MSRRPLQVQPDYARNVRDLARGLEAHAARVRQVADRVSADDADVLFAAAFEMRLVSSEVRNALRPKEARDAS